MNLHSPTPLSVIEQSVVFKLGLLSLVWGHREDLLLEAQIRKNEFLSFLQKFPRIGSEGGGIIDRLIRCGSRPVARETNDLTVVIHPEEDVKAISSMTVMVIRFGMHIKYGSAAQRDKGSVTRCNESRKPVFFVAEGR